MQLSNGCLEFGIDHITVLIKTLLHCLFIPFVDKIEPNRDKFPSIIFCLSVLIYVYTITLVWKVRSFVKMFVFSKITIQILGLLVSGLRAGKIAENKKKDWIINVQLSNGFVAGVRHTPYKIVLIKTILHCMFITVCW